MTPSNPPLLPITPWSVDAWLQSICPAEGLTEEGRLTLKSASTPTTPSSKAIHHPGLGAQLPLTYTLLQQLGQSSARQPAIPITPPSPLNNLHLPSSPPNDHRLRSSPFPPNCLPIPPSPVKDHQSRHPQNRKRKRGLSPVVVFTPAPPQCDGMDEDPRTPTTKGTTSSKRRQNEDAVSEMLKQYGMLFEDEEAFDRHPELQELISTHILPPRPSAVKPDSPARLKKKYSLYSTANEATFLNHILPHLIRDVFGAAPSDSEMSSACSLDGKEEESDTEAAELQSQIQQWHEIGLYEAIDTEFQRGLMPLEGSGLELLTPKEAKQEKWGLENPKPDRTFGFQRKCFPLPEGVRLPDEVTLLLEVAPSMYQPFFIIEGKSGQGDSIKVRNQARRGGATLVHAARLLRQKVDLGEEDYTPAVDGFRADLGTVVFSVTLTYEQFTVWIHWVQVSPSGYVAYHMNEIDCVSLKARDALEKCRRWSHNILWWGLVTRREQVNKLFAALIDQEGLKRENASPKKKQRTH